MPLFSIIVPVYNTELYLERCVNSILSQSMRDFELLLIDDGSLDSSPKICDRYSLQDKRIKVIHKQNEGVSSARNNGMAIATGEYIWFVDSDDAISPEALQRLWECIQSDAADLYVFNSPIQEFYTFSSLEQLLRDHYFYYHLGFAPWNKLYKRTILEENQLCFDTEEAIGEDLLFNITCYLSVRRISFLCEELYQYTVRENSAMTTIDDQRCRKQMRLFEKIRSLVADCVSNESLLCLYFMHLVSGINQTSAGHLKYRDRIHIIVTYLNYYRWSPIIYRRGMKAFLHNENAGILGRIRFKWYFGYWRYRLHCNMRK